MTSIAARIGSRLVVAFSGHRRLTDPAGVAARLESALDQLSHGGRRPLRAVSSAAAGADLIFAQIALTAGIPWEVWLPLPLRQFRSDFSAEDWATVERLLPRASARHSIRPGPTRDASYLRCGCRCVDASHLLVAVWDGRPARGPGGTADIVAYARHLGRPVLQIEP